VIGDARMRGVITPTQNRRLHQALSRKLSPLSDGGATSATNQPPLYYALAAVPYWVSPSHEILTRLAVMRLLSALLAAATALAVFLFVRELFPRTPWAWTLGALMVAFQPMVGFMSAGVQGDNLLYLICALIFLLLTRAYRRGLSTRRAVAIGAVTAAGLLTKLTFLSLIPGIALAVALLGWRELPRGRVLALGRMALAAAVAVIPFAVYAVLNVTAWHRGSVLAGGTAGVTGSTLPSGAHITLPESLDYIWELYLPRLPFMHHNYFPTGLPLRGVWLNGSIGHFGWLDYGFPLWVYTLGKWLVIPLVLLAAVGLFRVRGRIWHWLPLFTCFAVMAVGLLAAIGYAGIRYQLATGFGFAQARYLFPLLALYGLFTVLVARSVGRRWAPVLAAVLFLLAMAHNLFAETLTISRYYG
jgi:4-amino-4-deoxy-L-arabinose transferase-like glycosyltransferase